MFFGISKNFPDGYGLSDRLCGHVREGRTQCLLSVHKAGGCGDTKTRARDEHDRDSRHKLEAVINIC